MRNLFLWCLFMGDISYVVKSSHEGDALTVTLMFIAAIVVRGLFQDSTPAASSSESSHD